MIRTLYNENVIIQAKKEAEEKAEKKARADKLETAKSLIGILDIETIAEKFKLTAKEIEDLR